MTEIFSRGGLPSLSKAAERWAATILRPAREEPADLDEPLVLHVRAAFGETGPDEPLAVLLSDGVTCCAGEILSRSFEGAPFDSSAGWNALSIAALRDGAAMSINKAEFKLIPRPATIQFDPMILVSSATWIGRGGRQSGLGKPVSLGDSPALLPLLLNASLGKLASARVLHADSPAVAGLSADARVRRLLVLLAPFHSRSLSAALGAEENLRIALGDRPRNRLPKRATPNTAVAIAREKGGGDLLGLPSLTDSQEGNSVVGDETMSPLVDEP